MSRLPLSAHWHGGPAQRPARVWSSSCPAAFSAAVSISAGSPSHTPRRTTGARCGEKNAVTGRGVWLSHDAARLPRPPTLRTTLGVKGDRPIVGPWEKKDLGYCDAACHVGRGTLTTRFWEPPARQQQKTGHRTTHRCQAAFAAQLRASARAYPAESCQAVVITIDNAPWPRGGVVEEVLATYPPRRWFR